MIVRYRTLILVGLTVGLVPAAQALQSTNHEPPTYSPPVYERPLDINAGEILNLCDPRDAARAGLDVGEFTTELEARGINCGLGVSLGMVDASGTLIRGSRDELAQLAVPRLTEDLGSRLSPFLPNGKTAVDGLIPGSLQVRGNRVLGWVVSDSDAPAALTVNCTWGAEHASYSIPTVALPGEVLPFAAAFEWVAEGSPQCDVTSDPTSNGVEARMFAVTGSPGLWAGSLEEFPGMKGALDGVAWYEGETRTYYQTFIEPRAAKGVPGSESLVANGLGSVRVLAALTDEKGDLVDVRTVAVWSDHDTDLQVETLSDRVSGIVGLVLPDPSTTISLWVSVQPEVQ